MSISTAYVVYKGEEPQGTYLSLAETARALGVSERTVKWRMSPSARRQYGESDRALIIERVSYEG